jgi:cytochrome c553
MPIIHLFGLFAIIICSEGLAGWDAALLEREEAALLTADPENGGIIYEGCSACHMPEGWGTPNGAYPQIAGQHSTVIIKQLADIRAKNRDNPSMYPFAIPEEIGGAQALADVAAYIEDLQMTTATGKGEGSDLLFGENLYNENCTECHGQNGEGDENKAYPLIQGQHYNYVLRQLNWILSGKRRNANKEMKNTIDEFGKRGFKALADFVSRMAPDEERLSPFTRKNHR